MFPNFLEIFRRIPDLGQCDVKYDVFWLDIGESIIFKSEPIRM